MPAQCESLLATLEGVQVYRLAGMPGQEQDPAHRQERIAPAAKSAGRSLEGTLKALGISRKSQGYAYLQTAVEAVIQDPSLTVALTKRLYPHIAALHSTSAYGVERAIRYAVETAWARSDTGTWERLFGQFSHGKPTNGEFITYLVHLLEAEELGCDSNLLQP